MCVTYRKCARALAETTIRNELGNFKSDLKRGAGSQDKTTSMPINPSPGQEAIAIQIAHTVANVELRGMGIFRLKYWALKRGQCFLSLGVYSNAQLSCT